MKKLNIEHIGANVQFSHVVTFGNNNAFQATLQQEAWLYKTKNGKYEIDNIDFCDILNVKFLGIDIEGGYGGYQKFKKQMLEMGIDVNKLVDEQADLLITPQLKQQILNMFNKK